MLWGVLAGILGSLGVLQAARVSTRQGQPGPRVVGGVVMACAAGGAATASLTNPVLTALYALAVAVAVAGAAVDAMEHRLPNALTYLLAAGGLFALTVVSVMTGFGSPWRALVGCAIYGGWLFLASLTGLGPGDVKLAAGVGIWLGWYSWQVLLAGIACGQILITACYLVGRRRQLAGTSASGLPLGPAITAGFITAVFLMS